MEAAEDKNTTKCRLMTVQRHLRWIILETIYSHSVSAVPDSSDDHACPPHAVLGVPLCVLTCFQVYLDSPPGFSNLPSQRFLDHLEGRICRLFAH